MVVTRRNYWINNLLNWTRLKVVIKVKKIQRKHDINSVSVIIINGNSYSYKSSK